MLVAALVAAAAAPAHAADLSPPLVLAEARGRRRGKKGRRGAKKGGKKGPRGGKRRGRPHWKTDWYVQPKAGVRVVGNGQDTTTVASVGAEGGINHTYVNTPRPTWGGRSRVSVVQQFSEAGTGTDVRAGSLFGPHWKNLGIEAGPDLFWNRSTIDGFTLDPTFGVDLPVIGTLRVDRLQAYAGISPTWVSNPDRRVDWSQQDAFGFGHEFAYLAGASLRVDPATVGLAYEHRITAAGISRSIVFQADITDVIRGGSP